MGDARAPAECIARAVCCVPALVMRKAVVASRLADLPASDAVRVIEAWLERAPSEGAAKDALVALTAWQIELRTTGATAALEPLRAAADARGSAVVRALFDDAPPHKQLARHGRLREIAIPEHMDFGSRRHLLDWPFGRQRFLEQVRLHQSPVMIRRLLEQRWLGLRDALLIAARRPTTFAIALEAARSERWFRQVRYREALAMNPFTPTGISLALLPTLRSGVVLHLATGGDVHPLLAATAIGMSQLQRERRG